MTFDWQADWQIAPVNRAASADIQQHIDQKTKPLGALGQLEQLALQIALVQGRKRLSIERPLMLVFAADHGIADEGVSIAPSSVTQQMVQNFLAGGAAINCFCRTNHLPLKVIDAGIKYEIKPAPSALILQRIAAGTRNFANEPAMTVAQAQHALRLGKELAEAEIAAGSNLLAFGEMGIGNSSSAAAILAAVSGEAVERCVGLGTGINPEQLTKKIALVTQAVARIEDKSPLTILCEVGGFEIAQICGAMLATAQAGRLIVVDGFIVTAAALLAVQFNPNARDYMIFAHESEEAGHQLMLRLLDAKPLLNLGLRLGEGTGAALAMPIIQAAVSFYNQMATFESAGVKV
ncbi:nicotinate-nucleotide--dimethylbenzimidazole phosphoribosyltransferase [Cellvibrio sp. pealriver]|uniref:nicotinate-nucleotide--dimethylbenzimidazole phosphoribosyltransferase n=1 Tax=Cellvibrio sp. pealriver TaxID=1622269 RepID=UPI0009E50209|nr:nicotinate-nucleotide--dimethylbenzimidazole phosphoribosyltransferase [Cellvibrio sp. pealriver]